MKRTFKNLSLVLVFCMLITMSLAGCGGTATGSDNSTGTNTNNASKGNKSGVITLRYTYWGGNLEKQTTDQQIAKFEELHPNIKVDAQQIPTDYLTKLNTMAASNTLPDVGYMSESALVGWADKGMFLPLGTGSGDNEKLESLFFRNSKGEVVATSVANEVMVVFYNKDLFDQAGLEYPPADASKAWSWDKFIEVAQKLTVDQNGKHPTDSGFDPENIVTFGFNVPKWEMPWMALIMSNGGGLVSPDGKELTFIKKDTIDALQAIADLSNVYHVCPSPAQSSAVPSTDTALLTNKVAMTIDGQWALQVLGQAKIDQNLNYGIGVLPKFKVPATTNSGTGIVVFSTTKYPEEAKLFAEFINNPENSLDFIQTGLWMPNQKNWYTDQALIDVWTGNNNAYHPEEYKTAIIDYALNYTVQEPWYYLSYHDDLMNIITPALDNLWLGNDTAENIVNGIAPDLQKIFEANQK